MENKYVAQAFRFTGAGISVSHAVTYSFDCSGIMRFFHTFAAHKEKVL